VQDPAKAGNERSSAGAGKASRASCEAGRDIAQPGTATCVISRAGPHRQDHPSESENGIRGRTSQRRRWLRVGGIRVSRFLWDGGNYGTRRSACARFGPVRAPPPTGTQVFSQVALGSPGEADLAACRTVIAVGAGAAACLEAETGNILSGGPGLLDLIRRAWAARSYPEGLGCSILSGGPGLLAI